jgi:iron complex outermembrane receptor protein
MNRLKLIILFLLGANIISAQGIIKGNISNADTKESMVGVAVFIPELQKGTFSDKNGEYMLRNIPKGKFTIQFSYLGFETKNESVEVNSNEQKLDVELVSTYIYTPEVVVSAMGYTSQHVNAIKVESIKAQDLNKTSTNNIMDKLTTIPGLNIISQGPAISTPNIRGLSLSNVLVLNNGFRMNNYQFSEHHPYLVSNYGISKVELIKGPASLLYGSDAIGGVINFIGEQPAAVGTIEGDINTAYYSATKGYETNVGVKAQGKKFYWGVRAGLQQQADMRMGNGEVIPNSRFNDRGVQLFTGINNKLGNFNIKYNYKEAKLGLATPQAVLLVKDKGFNNEMWYQHLDYQQLSSRNSFYFNKMKFESNFSFQTNRRRLYGKDNYVVDMRLQNFDYEFKSTISPFNKYTQIIGIQGNYTQNKVGDAPIVVIPNYYQNDFSAFTLIQKDFDDKWHLQAGLRYDLRKLYIPNIPTTTQVEDLSLDTMYNSLNFTFGTTYEMNKNLFFRLNFASAFRSPNVAELTQDGVHETRYERGNIHLKTQKSHELDLGIHYHIQKLAFDFSVYYNQLDNYIYLSPTNDTAANGMEVFQYQQSNATLYGFETGLNYVPSKFIDTKINYTYTEGIQKDGSYLPFIPQNRLNASVNLNFKDYSIFHKNYFEISGIYAFSQNHVPDDEETSPAYFLLNAGIGTSLHIGGQKFNIGIYANNLLDATYVDYLSELREMDFYQMGRNISLKLSIPLNGNI